MLCEYKEVFYGTIDAASVYPREIVKLVLEYNSAAVIIAHNHPSWPGEIQDAEYVHCRRFLDYFDTVYTLNYDLRHVDGTIWNYKGDVMLVR